MPTGRPLMIAILTLAAGCGRGPASTLGDGGGSAGPVADACGLEGGAPGLDGGSPADQDTAPSEDRGPATREALLEHVRTGQWASALVVLDRLSGQARADGRDQYLRARLLESLGRLEEAAEAYDGVPGDLPQAVVRDVGFRRAALLAKTGRCQDAHKALTAFASQPGRLRHSAQALVADCALEASELEPAISLLTSLAKAKSGPSRRGDTFGASLKLALAYEKAGSPAEAQRVLRSLLIEQPENSQAKLAAARLEALGADLAFTQKERVARAQRLFDRRQYSKALTEINATKEPARPGQRARWLHLKGMILYRTRHNYDEASKVLHKASRFGGPHSVDDEFHAARARSRADKDVEAIASYRKLVTDHPTHPRAVEAEYLAAWLELRLDRSQGQARMKTFLDGPLGNKSQRLRQEALWHVAFWAFEKGRYWEAASYFDQYARAGHGGLTRGRGLYWEGRALAALGRTQKAITLYEHAVAAEPLHYYALLARQRLVEDLGQPEPTPFPNDRTVVSDPVPLLAVVLPDEAAFYASIGLDGDAQAWLRRQEPSLRSRAPRGREHEALASAYLQVGGARRAFRIALGRRSDLRRGPTKASYWVWQAAHPRPHAELVESLCREHGIEPAHVYATMRQESGFAERAVSPADAIGLLQMLPSTARAMAKQMGVELRREMLFQPAWNLRFGIAEIAKVHRANGGQLPLAIAAYNAGESRVDRWLRETGEVDLDLFVENIPFDETRNYVRRVLSHYARYRYLENPAIKWPVDLPRKVGG